MKRILIAALIAAAATPSGRRPPLGLGRRLFGQGLYGLPFGNVP
jgi:hypothetical protein